MPVMVIGPKSANRSRVTSSQRRGTASATRVRGPNPSVRSLSVPAQ
jgi:hypothetical protein